MLGSSCGLRSKGSLVVLVGAGGCNIMDVAGGVVTASHGSGRNPNLKHADFLPTTVKCLLKVMRSTSQRSNAAPTSIGTSKETVS